MTDIASSFRNLAEKLITQTFVSASQAATLRRVTSGEFSAQGEVLQSITSYSCRAIIAEIRAEQEAFARVSQANLRALIAAKTLPVRPTERDELIVAGQTYEIVAVETDAVTAVYTLFLRRP